MKKLLVMSAILLVSAAPAAAKEGDVILRLRAITVAPEEDADTTIGGSVEVSNYTVPELDITYFFTD